MILCVSMVVPGSYRIALVDFGWFFGDSVWLYGGSKWFCGGSR